MPHKHNSRTETAAITTRMRTATAIVTTTSMVAAIVIVSTIIVMIILGILAGYSCHVCLQKMKDNMIFYQSTLDCIKAVEQSNRDDDPNSNFCDATASHCKGKASEKPGKKQEEPLGAIQTKDERDIMKRDKKTNDCVGRCIRLYGKNKKYSIVIF